jgi:NhaP-type Na+/H+ or K+/H+ antiporter
MNEAIGLVMLVGLAAAVSTFADRTSLAAPSLLVVVGYAASFAPGLRHVTLSPTLVTVGLLPPLLFAAAEQISLPDLRQVWRPVAVLAVGLVAVSMAATALVAHAAAPSLSVDAALVIGAVLASTDPVAVTALSRELRLSIRLATLVQSESLFNDATSLLAFQAVVGAVVSGHTDSGSIAADFGRLALGGVALGAAVGALAWPLLRWSHRSGAAIGVAIATPYAAAGLAHVVGVSIVTAVIVSGLLVAPKRRAAIGTPSRSRVVRGYERIVRLVEDVVFALIGLELGSALRALPSSANGTTLRLVAAVAATLVVVRALALAVGAMASAGRDGWRAAAVATWAGTRGVIPFIAALSVPATVDGGGAFPDRTVIVVVALSTTALGLVVQGLTLRRLVRRLGAGTSAEGAP